MVKKLLLSLFTAGVITLSCSGEAAPVQTPTPTSTPRAIPTATARPVESPTPVIQPTVIIPEETPTATPKITDPLVELVDSNPDLSYNLTDRTKQSMLKELKESPYVSLLLPRINLLSEAWNYKVRREDKVLCVIVPQYTPDFDCNSEEVWQFRFDNGSYHLQLWLDGDSILPLDNVGLNEWFEKKEDVEFAMMQMWIPDGMIEYDVTQWKYSGGFQPFFTGMRNDMDVILGKKEINELSQFKDLRDRIVRVRDDPSLKSYSRPEVFGTDFEEASFHWLRQVERVPQSGLINVPDLYSSTVIPILEQNSKDFELIKLAYGLGILDKGPHDVESSDTVINQIYDKSLGYITFNQLGRVPTNIGDRQYVALVVSQHSLSKIRQPGVIVYRGQSVSPYSMEEGLRKDGVHYVRIPNGAEIIWRLQ